MIADWRPGVAHYSDPDLWVRLEPRLREHYDDTVRGIIATPLPSYEEYRARIGYLRALEWVMREAADLTRLEPQSREEE